ncbi:MAG: polymerase sigma factor RpoE [Pseudomonadota bacterium]
MLTRDLSSRRFTAFRSSPDALRICGLMSGSVQDHTGWDENSRCILAIAANADRESFARLFAFFAPRVKSYLMRSGADAAEAEELAQEALLAVWRKAASFDPARATASTWIFTIARNLWIDGIRRAKRRSQMVDTSWDIEPVEQPGERLIATDTERSVTAALKMLPPDQVEVIRLSFFEGRPHAEIAERLSLPLGTVKSRIRLACGRLRKLLEDLV